MINKELLELAGELQNAANNQMKAAKDSISSLPEGETKTALSNLLRKASSGKSDMRDVQRELNKIITNARTD